MAPARKSILVVEDDYDLRNIFKDALTFVGGFEVRATHDGVDALGIMEGWRPDLIVLDI